LDELDHIDTHKFVADAPNQVEDIPSYIDVLIGVLKIYLRLAWLRKGIKVNDIRN